VAKTVDINKSNIDYRRNYMKDAERGREQSAVMNVCIKDEGNFIMIYAH